MIFVFLWLTSLSIIISRSIYVAANDTVSFFFYGWAIFHCIYVPRFFIHSSVDGHLYYFHVSAIVNSAATNIRGMYLFKLCFFFFLDICPRSRISGLYGNSIVFFFFLVFWGSSILFSIVAEPISIHTNSRKSFAYLKVGLFGFLFLSIGMLSCLSLS